MKTIFRDEELYTHHNIPIPYNETIKDNGYGFYCDLDVYDIENNSFELEMKYNKKVMEEQIRNDVIKHFEKKYKVYADYCMFGLIVFSCSMLLF
jgi:IS4 transposase